MSKLYVIHDTKLKVDLVPFLHHIEGAAKNHFVQYSRSAGHSEFALYSVMEYGYSEVEGIFEVISIDRTFIMNAPIIEEDDYVD